MKNLWIKYGSVLAALAMMVATSNANAACVWMNHQPKLPKGVEKLRKF